MPDQAEQLRRLIAVAEPTLAGDQALPPTVVVTGGKGGVGATMVALNLAVTISQQGSRTVLIDAAPYADVAHRAGIDDAGQTGWHDVLAGTCNIDEALHPGPAGIYVLPGRSAPAVPPDRSSRAADRLLSRLPALAPQFDAVVIDSGGGMSPWSRTLWRRAGFALVVTTPDDTALIDAYATIKQSGTHDEATDVRLLVNQCDAAALAADAQRRIAQACRRFLGLSIGPAPRLPRADAAENRCWDLPTWHQPRSPFCRHVTQLGRFVASVLSHRRGNAGPGDRVAPPTPEFSTC